MSKPTSARARRSVAILTAAALILTGGLVLAAPACRAPNAPSRSSAASRANWAAPTTGSPSARHRPRRRPPSAGVYAAEFDVPAGSCEYKVAVNDAWDESYGPDGGGDNIPLTVAGPSTLRFLFDDNTDRVGVEVVSLRAGYTADDDALVAAPVRQAGSQEQFYFVMTDRFANGDASNDTAGIAGDRLANGFDPTDKGFYNGGDIAGLRSQLDYIDGPRHDRRSGSPRASRTGPCRAPARTPAPATTATGSPTSRRSTRTSAPTPSSRRSSTTRTPAASTSTSTSSRTTPPTSSRTRRAVLLRRPGAPAPTPTPSGTAFDPADYAGTDTFPALDPATSLPVHARHRARGPGPQGARVAQRPDAVPQPRQLDLGGRVGHATATSTDSTTS